jgi:ribose/xylose/arabinose/galactoside ABC-type transport system permease subunit
MTIRHRHRPLLAGILALTALYAAAALRYHDRGFLSPRIPINLLGDNSVLGIVAVGMTLVILSGGIDLSVGAAMSFASILTGVLLMEHRWPAPAAMLTAVAASTTLGLLSGLTIAFSGVPPFVVTLAAMFFIRGLAYVIRLEPIAIDDPTHAAIASWYLPLGDWGRLPISACAFLGAVFVTVYIARFTRFGRAVYAVGGSEEAARLMGLPVAFTKVLVYGFSGLCAGIAGVVLSIYLSGGSHVEGVGLELDAIAAVVIGGTLLTGGVGGVVGTLIGTLMIGLILTAISYEGTFSSGLTRLVVAGLMLAFVVLQRALTREST